LTESTTLWLAKSTSRCRTCSSLSS
jgi:hypothetical protein